MRSITYRLGCTVISWDDESQRSRLILRGHYLTPQAVAFAVARGMGRAVVRLK